MKFICSKCKASYPEIGMPHICKCGGHFLPDSNYVISKKDLFSNQPEIPYWRFSAIFGLFPNATPTYLGEGNTPIIQYKNVYLKMESNNPTGSYKDRNSALLISQMQARGVTEFVEDSSGNAGASISAYAAYAGMKANIYAPSYVSGVKKRQIEAFGANLILIDGLRQAATDALLKKIKTGSIYASHALMPFGILGIATISFELVETFGNTIDSVIIPAGHGGLLYGIIWGFQLMLNNEIITKLPMFYGIQSEKCAPLSASKKNGYNFLEKVEQQNSIAEGILIKNPSKAEPLLGFAREGLLDFVTVTEGEISAALDELNQSGINIEHTSAVVIASMEKLNLSKQTINIALISGNGLKTI